MTTREEAIDTLERGHREVRRLIKRIPPHWMARPGVGDGGWTPKDLLGHLCSWEEKVLEAMAAWEAGERAPIDRDIHARSIGARSPASHAAIASRTFSSQEQRCPSRSFGVHPPSPTPGRAIQ